MFISRLAPAVFRRRLNHLFIHCKYCGKRKCLILISFFFFKEFCCNTRYVLLIHKKPLYKTKSKRYKRISLVDNEPHPPACRLSDEKEGSPSLNVLILYAACHVLCRLRFPLSASSVWGVHPRVPSASPPVWRRRRRRQRSSERRLRASTAAPQSVPPPRPLCGGHPPNRVWLCPCSTGCVRMTASGLSGACPSKTCPERSMKKHY